MNMTKTLKFVSAIILFFSLFLTAKLEDPRYIWNCKEDKDCHIILEASAEDFERLNARGQQLICWNGFCRITRL
jgi:hypothetical protein